VPEYPDNIDGTGVSRDNAVVGMFKQAYNRLRNDTKLPVYVLAHRLGVALALHACVDQDPDGAVLVSGFSSIRNLAPDYLSCVLPDRLNNVHAIEKYKCQIHIVHGTADSIIPYKHAETLQRACKHGNGLLHKMNFDHNPSNWAYILEILKGLVPPGNPQCTHVDYPPYNGH